MSSEIAITNLNFRTSIDDIYRAFSQFGELVSCRLMINERLESKGYGFIAYNLEKNAIEAISQMNGFKMDGHILIVTWAKGRIDGINKLPHQDIFSKEIEEKNKNYKKKYKKHYN